MDLQMHLSMHMEHVSMSEASIKNVKYLFPYNVQREEYHQLRHSAFPGQNCVALLLTRLLIKV